MQMSQGSSAAALAKAALLKSTGDNRHSDILPTLVFSVVLIVS